MKHVHFKLSLNFNPIFQMKYNKNYRKIQPFFISYFIFFIFKKETINGTIISSFILHKTHLIRIQ